MTVPAARRPGASVARHTGVVEDNVIAAAGLTRVSPFAPGLRRVRGPDGFEYDAEEGGRIVERATLERIAHLAIPPAWRDVWIATDPLGHIQATGFDSAGRKQYRYHPAWRDLRDHVKFDEVATFGQTLPAVRTRVENELTAAGLGSRRVLSCAVRLLDMGSFRIGGDRYAVHDDTHGLTTMLAGNVHIDGQTIVFDYIGKDSKHQVQHVVDVEAGSVVSQLLELRAPEQRLFAFADGSRWVDLHAGDVNHFLKEASGMSSSAKEFRTWNATVLAAAALAADGVASPAKGSRQASARAITAATARVAEYLGNTPAIARSSYVDPRVFASYRAGWTIDPELARHGIPLEVHPPATRRPVEAAVLDLIQQNWGSSALRPRPATAG